MTVSTNQQLSVAKYIAKKKYENIKRFPLVLMLEPHFMNNLKSPVCGKYDFPEAVLKEYLSPMKCVYAAEECGAPIIAISGGEPLMSDDMPEIVDDLLKKKKFIYLSTNGTLLSKKIYDFSPSKYFTWAVTLNGLREDHDKVIGQEGVFDTAIHAIKLAKTRGFRVTINCNIYLYQRVKNTVEFLNFIHKELEVDGINITPGYSYERAEDQKNFLNRENVKKIFRTIFKSKDFKKWDLNHTTFYLDFLAGNRIYSCAPWAMPTRNIFGWQKPCYHLAEGYYKTFEELMEKTDWKQYGTGNYEKCKDCMTHCGYEASAISEIYENPIKAIYKKYSGIKTTGPMPEDISLTSSRPAEDIFDKLIESKMYELDLM